MSTVSGKISNVSGAPALCSSVLIVPLSPLNGGVVVEPAPYYVEVHDGLVSFDIVDGLHALNFMRTRADIPTSGYDSVYIQVSGDMSLSDAVTAGELAVRHRGDRELLDETVSRVVAAAVAAEGSKVAAAASATQANESKDAAAQSAQEADGSKQAAAQSAAAAHGSEDAAAASATHADEAKQAAAASATQAHGSEDAAAASAAAANESKDAAAQSAQEADGSKQAAAQSATQADEAANRAKAAQTAVHGVETPERTKGDIVAATNDGYVEVKPATSDDTQDAETLFAALDEHPNRVINASDMKRVGPAIIDTVVEEKGSTTETEGKLAKWGAQFKATIQGWMRALLADESTDRVNNSDGANKVVRTDGEGKLKVYTPVNPMDVVNKQYVDEPVIKTWEGGPGDKLKIYKIGRICYLSTNGFWSIDELSQVVVPEEFRPINYWVVGVTSSDNPSLSRNDTGTVTLYRHNGRMFFAGYYGGICRFSMTYITKE